MGLFASGEWKGLNREMEDFELGKFLYVNTLIWTAIAWQIFTIGAVGLILEPVLQCHKCVGFGFYSSYSCNLLPRRNGWGKGDFHVVGYLGLYFIFLSALPR